MEFNVIARRFTLTDAISDYVKEKIDSATERISPSPISAHVILSIEKKYRHYAEIVLKIPRRKFLAKGMATDLYAAIDIAVEKLSRQLVKYKEKIKDHRSKVAVLRKKAIAPAGDEGQEVEISIFEKPNSTEVAETKNFVIQNLSVSDAMEALERSGYNFYVFNNTRTNNLNIVYKRGDGRIGLMELLVPSV